MPSASLSANAPQRGAFSFASLLCLRLHPSIFALSGGFACRPRIRLGEHAGYSAAHNPDADAVSDVDGHLLRVVRSRNRSDDAASGDDPVAAPQRVEHCSLIFCFALLRPDQQKVEDDKNQDQRQELDERLAVEKAGTLRIGGGDQHRHRASRSCAASTRKSSAAATPKERRPNDRKLVRDAWVKSNGRLSRR